MQNSYSIEDLIEMLEDLIHDATRVPFGKKSMVDVAKLNDIVSDMRLVLPTEIRQAQKVVEDKNRIIHDAEKEAKKCDDKVKTAIYKLDWFNIIQVDVYYLKRYTKVIIWNRSKNDKEVK